MELYNDHFQNYKRYNVPKAQLVIADIPYNIGDNAYGSSPRWYVDGDNKNGESEFAHKAFFDTDKDFRIMEFFHFCNRLVKPEPKGTAAELKERKKEPGCMIVFCAWEQQQYLTEKAAEYGFPNFIPLVFRKNYSAQVLKANMRIVGNCEYAILFYRDKLPKFRNNGRMVFNCMDYIRDNDTPKVHPTQKSRHVLEQLIEIFTDPGDVVIDPVAGSGVTLLAAESLGRKAYGFEIKKEFCKAFHEQIEPCANQMRMVI